MNRLAIVVVFLSACSLNADELAPEIIKLAQLKRQAAADLKRLPSFTCLANFERYRQREPKSPLRSSNPVRVDIVYADRHERFGWPGSNQMDSSLGELVGTGLTSDGEFIVYATNLFVHDNGTARFAGEEELRGRRVLRYDYHVPSLLSGYQLSFPAGAAIVGMKGSFWADKQTLNVLRLRVEADQIPESLGVRDVVTEIDYARTRLGSQVLSMFPQRATVSITTQSETLRNEVEYTHCREFQTTSTLSFDNVEEANPPKPTARVRKPQELPPGLKLRIQLKQAISAQQWLGEPVIGEVVGGPYNGATVVGRIRVSESVDAKRTVLGIELTDLITDGQKIRLFATATQIDPTFRGSILTSREVPLSSSYSMRFPNLPGVVFLLAKATQSVLVPAGTWIDWRVLSIAH